MPSIITGLVQRPHVDKRPPPARILSPRRAPSGAAGRTPRCTVAITRPDVTTSTTDALVARRVPPQVGGLGTDPARGIPHPSRMRRGSTLGNEPRPNPRGGKRCPARTSWTWAGYPRARARGPRVERKHALRRGQGRIMPRLQTPLRSRGSQLLLVCKGTRRTIRATTTTRREVVQQLPALRRIPPVPRPMVKGGRRPPRA